MGKPNSLLLLLDIGKSNSSFGQINTTKPEWTNETKAVDISTSNEEKTSSRIYVQTLSETSFFGAGSYAMSALNHMVGSRSFMEFPDEMKECQTGSLEGCHSINYFSKLKQQCQCIPWSLRLFNPFDEEVQSFQSLSAGRVSQ